VGRYLLTRLVLLVPTWFGVSVATFLLIRLVPGDLVAIVLGVQGAADPAVRARMEAQLDLDKPLYVQYFLWLARIFQGDLGNSLIHGTSVRDEIVRRLPATLELAIMALAIALLLGVPIGVFTATRHGRLSDVLVRATSLLTISAPGFFVGSLMIVLGALYLPGAQMVGYVPIERDPVASLQQMLWPALALGLAVMAIVMRYTRASMLEVLGQDYVRVARAKGLAERVVIYRHALRNALVPVISIVGVQASYLVGGAVIIENVFAIPGLGRLMINAINQRDYTVVQGAVLVVATGVVLVNLAVDLLYRPIDPRIRYA